MPRTSKKSPTADEIAGMASRGKDVSKYFTNKFTVAGPDRRGSVSPAQKRALSEERRGRSRS